MNENGFVTIAIVILLPLLFLLSFACGWLIWFMNNKHQLDNLCHEAVLSSQEMLVESNDKLLLLNSQAYSLIMKKRALDVIILTAPPHLKIPAQAQRKVVVLQQKALRIKQKAIVYVGNVRSRSRLMGLRSNFYAHVRDIQKFWKSEQHARAMIRIYWKPSQVTPKIQDIAPVFQRAAQHDSRQAFSVDWEIPLQALAPKWIKQIIPIHKGWLGQCDSHPMKGGFKWSATIGKVSPLLKP